MNPFIHVFIRRDGETLLIIFFMTCYKNSYYNVQLSDKKMKKWLKDHFLIY